MRQCDKLPGNTPTDQAQITFQGGDVDDRKMISWKFDQQAIRKALTYMIIADELPFKFVEGRGLRHFLNACQPSFYLPSRITMARDCYELFLEERKKVGALLQGNIGRICLTTDTWTSA